MILPWLSRKPLGASMTRLFSLPAALLMTVMPPLVPPSAGMQMTSLPIPTGRFAIGTCVAHLVDGARLNVTSKQPGRDLMVQLWYPTSVRSGKKADYVPDRRLLPVLQAKLGIAQAEATEIAELQTHAVLDAPALRGRFPLILFSPGLGMSRFQYTAIAEEFVSRGYIVAAIDHPHGGVTVLPDGRILSFKDDPTPNKDSTEANGRRVFEWASDASFALTALTDSSNETVGRFAEHVAPHRVGIAGQSFGGAAALEACRRDARFAACADLDGWLFGDVKQAGVPRPTLIVRSQPVYTDEELKAKGRDPKQWEAMGREIAEGFAAVLRLHRDVGSYLAGIRGATHMTYSDAPFLMPSMVLDLGGRTLSPQRGHDVMMALLVAFFDQYLREGPADWSTELPRRDSELTIQRFDDVSVLRE